MAATARIWTLAITLGIIVVIALAWFLGASPRLADAATAQAETQSVRAQNDTLRITNAQLRADFERLPELRAELEVLRAEFPELPQYDVLVAEYQSLAQSFELELTSLSIAEPFPASPDIATDENGQVPRGTLLAVPVTSTMVGERANILAFVEALQLSDRFSLVTSIGIEGAGEGASASLGATLYVLSGEPAPVTTPGVGVGAPSEPATPGSGEDSEPSADQ